MACVYFKLLQGEPKVQKNMDKKNIQLGLHNFVFIKMNTENTDPVAILEHCFQLLSNRKILPLFPRFFLYGQEKGH
jgi:hypothetical protein